MFCAFADTWALGFCLPWNRTSINGLTDQINIHSNSFIMSGEHWGINVTPSSGKMVTFTLSYAVVFFFPNHLVWQWTIFVKIIKNVLMSLAQAITATTWNNKIVYLFMPFSFFYWPHKNFYLHSTLCVFRDSFLLVQNTEKCM